MVQNSRGAVTIAVQTLFTSLALIVVALRLYVRFGVIHSPGYEDYVIIVSMLCSIGLTVGYGCEVKYGMGLHMDQIPEANMVPLFKLLFACVFLYDLTLGLTKISIALQLIRVFASRIYHVTFWVMIGYTLYSVFSGIFNCLPVSFVWDKSLDGSCPYQLQLWYANGGLNIITDLWLLILPIRAVKSLHLPRRQKVGLIVVFAMGGVVTLISVLRIPNLVTTSKSTDLTYENIEVGIYSSVEVNVGIICASLPCLKRLLPRLLAPMSIFRSSRSRSKGDDDKGLQQWGVESSASHSWPLERLSEGKSDLEAAMNAFDKKHSGIKITKSFEQIVNGGKPDTAEESMSLSDSERRLVLMK